MLRDEPCPRWGYEVPRVTLWGESGGGDPGVVRRALGLAQHRCTGWCQPKKAMLRLRGCGRSRMRLRAVGFFLVWVDPAQPPLWSCGAGATSGASCPARVKPQPGHHCLWSPPTSPNLIYCQLGREFAWFNVYFANVISERGNTCINTRTSSRRLVPSSHSDV